MLAAHSWQQCLQWASKHCNWTTEEIRKIIWFNESCFGVHHIDGWVQTCRIQIETMAVEVGQIQINDCSIMILIMFSWAALERILPIGQSLTCCPVEQYCTVDSFLYGNNVLEGQLFLPTGNASSHKVWISINKKHFVTFMSCVGSKFIWYLDGALFNLEQQVWAITWLSVIYQKYDLVKSMFCLISVVCRWMLGLLKQIVIM